MAEYPWKRFWIPRGETADLSDSGFSNVPEGKYAKYYPSNLFSFEKIADTPCLILLGEPGIGKTTAISNIVDDLSENLPSDQLLHMDLSEYGNESRLVGDIFESDKFKDWIKGSHILHMFLDSLDECHISIGTVGVILSTNLKKVSSQLSRIHLRIVCRTADWLSIMEKRLPVLWGEDNFGIFELAPLRSEDVRIATDIKGIEGDNFFRELERTESGPLAARPVTLNFLLKIFRKDNKLPATRTELYEVGCKELCKESSDYRQDLRVGKLSPQQSMTIASRIAAVCIFCQKSAIYDDSQIDLEENEDEIGISELAGGKEKLGLDTLSISESNIREVLRTALFSSRGANKMGFAHRTYAEFLAARYLFDTAEMSTDKVLRLFQHPNDPDKRVVPQLYETAGWVAGIEMEFLKTIAGSDPQILLQTDAGMLNVEARELIVDEFLKALDQHRINDRDWKLYHHYHKLNYPKLAEQLSPWLIDSDKPINSRNNAIDIAEACGLSTVQSELARLALEPGEDASIRRNAACAVARIADKDTRKLLRPLALGQVPEDSRDQLKGYAFRALWPGLITAEELFQNITPPKKSNFFGAYSHFIGHQLPEELDPQDLPFALKWLESQFRNKFFIRRFFPLFDKTMILSWNHMGNSEVFIALVDACVELMNNHMGLLQDRDKKKENSDIFDDFNKRRKLGKAVVEKSLDKNICIELIWQWPKIIRSEDFKWCAEELLSSISQPTEVLWAKLTLILFRWSNFSENNLNILIDARSKSPKLQTISENDFSPVELGSKQAIKLKEEYEQINASIVKNKPKTLDYSSEDKVVELLGRFESGEYALWKDIVFWMSLDEGDDPSDYHGYKFMELDIRKFPGWKNSDESFHFRILKTAADYLAQRNINHEELYSGDNQNTSPATQAFFILWELDRDKIDKLTNDVLKYWAPLILSGFEVEGKEVQRNLIFKAYQRIPEKIAEVFRNILDSEVDNNGRPTIVLDIVESLWDQRIRNIAYKTLLQAEDKPVCWADLLKALVIHGDEESIELANKKLLLANSEKNIHYQLAFQSAVVLFIFAQDSSWEVIWPILDKNAEFGRQVIMEVSYSQYKKIFVNNLKEKEIAQLFIWMVNEFPYSKDSDHSNNEMAVPVTQDRTARDLRDSLIGILRGYGTHASCEAIQTISEAFPLPEFDWIKSVLVDARKNTLKQSWAPFKVTDFMKFTSKPDSILVRSAGELQELIMQSLSRLEQLLQGETPAAPDLWDQVCRKQKHEKFRPKDENHFSDWIKRNLELELRGRGIVVGREVEIRRGEGSGTGEKTDIHVSVSVPGSSEGVLEKVSVIIESKGCWNPGLMESMKDQLIDRYLQDNPCKHGIYLVGWYDCPQWDNGDYRKNNTPKCSLEEARQFFEQQACSLSINDLSVRAFVINAALR